MVLIYEDHIYAPSVQKEFAGSIWERMKRDLGNRSGRGFEKGYAGRIWGESGGAGPVIEKRE